MDRTQLQNLFDMTGRVAVVTGGTRGIGRAIAEGYVAAGASVAVVSRNEQDCKDTAEHLRSLGGEAIGFAADMGNLDDVRTIVERTVSELGGLDVLVNNAGVGPFHTIAPGPFDTELLRSQTPDPNAVGGMTILQRVAAPAEIVGPALMLTSDAGSFMTGQVLMVDGGFVVAR
jgi:NAD(P)-dependent dehydrogenase (short-subunit alcohol dehydrogenase family)